MHALWKQMGQGGTIGEGKESSHTSRGWIWWWEVSVSQEDTNCMSYKLSQPYHYLKKLQGPQVKGTVSED